MKKIYIVHTKTFICESYFTKVGDAMKYAKETGLEPSEYRIKELINFGE